jgi:hypothetical protein
MNAKMTLNIKDMDRDDLQAFIQMVRDWELRTPKSSITGILINTEPELTTEETTELFAGVFPDFESLVEIPIPQGAVLRLGTRQVLVNDQLVGVLEELCLNIGSTNDTVTKLLEDAEIIGLKKVERC